MMIWMMIWAGLFIAVLYSPIGSPNLYYTQYYYSVNNSTPFNNGVIPNASSVKFTADNNSSELDIPDLSNSGLRSMMGGAGSYRSAGTVSSGSSYSSSLPQTYQNNSSPSSGNIGGGGISIIAGNGSHSSAGSSGIVMTNGIASLTTSNLSTTNTSTRQLTTQTLTGGTDPGGDPSGDPIPVGDGWGLLIFLATCYGVFNYRISLKRKSNISI